MNILFLTLVGIESIESRGIYQDLLRKFRDEGHQVTIITPVERRKKMPTHFFSKEGVSILQLKTLNITKTNVVEKGIGTIAMEYQYLAAIKKYFKNVKFDIVLYSTPPITFSKVISYLKERDNAYSYLLLKDIFPQNAIDMGMMKKNSFLHRQFLKKEKKLYEVSDTIGCMSQANVDFVLRHNPEISKDKVEVNPNSIDPIEILYTDEEKQEIRTKYKLPLDKKILVYGGNLGKPQGIGFLLETIEKCNVENAHFLVIGRGTEYEKIEKWFEVNKPTNATLMQRLPKADYLKLLASCDVGLIFLHKNFLIPNFPSRLLSYLEMRKPVITATDPHTDIGDVVEKANCGFKVISGDIQKMNQHIYNICNNEDLYETYSTNARELLEKEFTVERSYNLIINKIQ